MKWTNFRRVHFSFLFSLILRYWTNKSNKISLKQVCFTSRKWEMCVDSTLEPTQRNDGNSAMHFLLISSNNKREACWGDEWEWRHLESDEKKSRLSSPSKAENVLGATLSFRSSFFREANEWKLPCVIWISISCFLLHYEAQKTVKLKKQQKLETNFLECLLTLIFISRMFPLFALPYFFTFEHYHCVHRLFFLFFFPPLTDKFHELLSNFVRFLRRKLYFRLFD